VIVRRWATGKHTYIAGQSKTMAGLKNIPGIAEIREF
jgi:hypothetical protein